MLFFKLFKCKPKSFLCFRRWLKYGSFFNVLSTNLTGLVILVHFRRRFHLGNHGYFTSVAATLMAPAVITIGASRYIQNSVLLGSSCPTCLEVRGGVVQVLSSFGYQAVIVPITCIYLSRRYNTNLLAKQNFQPNVLFALKNIKASVYSSFILIALNAAIGYYTVYRQGQEMDTVIMKEAISKGKAFLDQLSD